MGILHKRRIATAQLAITPRPGPYISAQVMECLDSGTLVAGHHDQKYNDDRPDLHPLSYRSSAVRVKGFRGFIPEAPIIWINFPVLQHRKTCSLMLRPS